MSELVEVVEFTDPACPWAWGSEPKFRWLRLATERLDVRWRRVFGILFDTDDDPAPDPDAEAAWYAEFIAEVAAHTGAPYAHRLHWLTRTSWPASIVAKAVESQGKDVAERVVRRLRETTFVTGRPADETQSALAAVRSVPGVDIERLTRDLPAAEEAVRHDWAETRSPCREVRTLQHPGPHGGRAKEVNGRLRYALPTLVLHGPAGRRVVPGWRPLPEYVSALESVADVSLEPPQLSADEALRRFGSLTAAEFDVLTPNEKPPRWAVSVRTGNGPLWTDPETWDAASAD